MALVSSGVSTLFSADTIFVEQPFSATNLFLRTSYRVEAFDVRDVPLAVVDEPDKSLLAKPVRLTQLSGNTPFTLRVADPDRRQLLTISKGFSLRKPRTEVTGPNGEKIGSIKREGPREFPIFDAQGQQICLFDFHTGQFGDVARLERRVPAQRDGQRVGRDVLHLRPGTPQPLRTLVIATVLALDVVRNFGTARGNVISWG